MLRNDTLYENKTFKYLFPCLIDYDRVFINKLNELVLAGVFIADMNYYTLNSCLYLVINTKPFQENFYLTNYRKKVQDFLCWVKLQYFYETDYLYQMDFHVVVIKLFIELSSAIDSFMSGEYSKMFTIEQVSKYFKTVTLKNKTLEEERNKEIREARSVLTKDPTYLKEYVQKINKEYETNVSPKYFYNVELDTPPDLSKEILNY